MSKKSVVVSGMGLGLGMLTNANQIRKEMGITDEQFHALATDAGREHWERLFEGMMVSDENCYEIHQITIGCYKSLDEVIKAGQYDWHDDDITSEHFPITESVQTDIEIFLVHRDKSEDSQKLIDEMSTGDYRPATHEELLALGAQRPELQGKFPIIALGTVVQYNGDRYVLYFKDRILDIFWFDCEWELSCRFAFVRKSLEN